MHRNDCQRSLSALGNDAQQAISNDRHPLFEMPLETEKIVNNLQVPIRWPIFSNNKCNCNDITGNGFQTSFLRGSKAHKCNIALANLPIISVNHPDHTS